MKKPLVLNIDPALKLDIGHVTSVPPSITQPNEILSEHALFSDALKNKALIVQKPSDLKKSGLRILCGLQHPPVFGNKIEIFGTPILLALKHTGLRFCTLAYELTTPYGGGFATPNEPLSEEGRRFITFLAKHRICLDLSHVGHRTARDALHYIRTECQSARVTVSHSGCYAVYPHLRNLPDDILKEVVELGGVIGLPTATFMLHTSDNTLTSFFTHLRHAINLVGERNVAIGSDGIYHYLDPEAERRLFDTLNTKIDPRGNFMARCPGQPPELNTSERMLVLERSLKEEAFTPSQIENVLGNNLFHFFQSVL